MNRTAACPRVSERSTSSAGASDGPRSFSEVILLLLLLRVGHVTLQVGLTAAAS